MIKKRRFIRTVSYLLAVCIVVACAAGFSASAKASYEETLEKMRLDALNSLCEYTGVLSTSLSLLSAMPEESTVSLAQACVSVILEVSVCFDRDRIPNICRFMNHVYSFLQDFEDRENFRKAASELSDYAQELYYHLSDITVAAMNSEYSLSEYGSIYKRNEKPYFEDYLDFSNGKESELYSLEVSAVSQSAECEILKGKETVLPSQARERASEIINISPVLWREKENDGGEYEVYTFCHGDTMLELTKAGGLLCRLINPMPCDERLLTAADAVSRAGNFLELQGYHAEPFALRMTHFTADFLFVPEACGVMLMNAPIEISVCLSSGGITYFDAAEYIENYRKQVSVYPPDGDISELIPGSFTPQVASLCIADIRGRERFCVLAASEFEGGTVFAYLDFNDYSVMKTQKFSFTDLI